MIPSRSLKVSDYARDGFSDIAKFRRPIGAQAGNVIHRANRLMDHRPFAGLEFEVQPHALEGKQQIGEDDRRIDIQFFRSGDRDLGGQLRLLADFE